MFDGSLQAQLSASGDGNASATLVVGNVTCTVEIDLIEGNATAVAFDVVLKVMAAEVAAADGAHIMRSPFGSRQEYLMVCISLSAVLLPVPSSSSSSSSSSKSQSSVYSTALHTSLLVFLFPSLSTLVSCCPFVHWQHHWQHRSVRPRATSFCPWLRLQTAVASRRICCA